MMAGDTTQADAWLDRASRLAHGDATLDLLRASAMLDRDLDGCRKLIRLLLSRHPRFRDARVLLIACETRARDPQAARAALISLLALHAPPKDAKFTRLADATARSGGEAGWLGMNCAGEAILSVAPQVTDRPVQLKLDGRVLKRGRVAAQHPSRVRLPADWRRGQFLEATCGGTPLFGSPLALSPFAATEGVVDLTPEGGLTGWAWHPADPDRPAALKVSIRDDLAGLHAELDALASDDAHSSASHDGVEQRRRFHVAADVVPLVGKVRVIAADGRDLAGSPLLLGRERTAARGAAVAIAHAYPVACAEQRHDTGTDKWRPLDAGSIPRGLAAIQSRSVPVRRLLDVVIPVFRGRADFVACLATLRGNLSSGTRIIVVDDCSTDSALCEVTAGLAASGEIELLRHPSNRGFPAAANTGMRFSAGHGLRDILLLNCDTLLPPNAAERLASAAYADGRTGSVTPMTNDGTILSYPRTGGGNDTPDLAEVIRLDSAFNLANREQLVDIPTAIGFCMFIRHDCLAETGLFRDDIFAQGYGEENDWCLRASHLGWRHVAAAGVFVGHVGGQSFGAVKSHLVGRNVKLLNQLHPGYDELIANFIECDPLAPIRRAVDMARWRERRVPAGAVVLITHNRGGGVERHVRERCEAISAEGLRPVVVHPGNDASSCRIADGETREFDNLAFRLPDEIDSLVFFLTEEAPRHVELHHLIGHGPEMLDLARSLGVALDVYIHDYAQWCPRVTLVSYGDKYCGEPTRVEDCIACVADLGSRLDDPIAVAPLRQRSAVMLAAARSVIVPSEDAARRMRRHFPMVRPVIGTWEDDSALMATLATARPPATAAGEKTKIVIPGAIGYDKGYDVVLACARDAARRDLRLEFTVVGHTVDDGRLLDTGRAFVTGQYTEAEGPGLVGAQHAHLGFVPSVWPETWCYALSLLWRSGLRSVAFDIGAQAERIRRADAGWLIPIGLPPPRVNDLLIRLATRT